MKYDEMPKADVYGDYSQALGRPKGATRGTTCSDCVHDKLTKVDGKYLLCQKEGGGKDDLSCWDKREVTKGGKVVAHIERRGRPRGSGGPVRSKKYFFGKNLDDISVECGVPNEALLQRIRKNPDITWEKFTKPINKRMQRAKNDI